jgi:hypothetical protein
VRNQVLHPCKATGKITDLYILIFRLILLNNRWEGKDSKMHVGKQKLICSNSSWMKFCFFFVVLKDLKLATFSNDLIVYVFDQ